MLNPFRTPFQGFVREDFQVYTEDKWASNIFTRQRMQVREKLDAIAEAVAPRLAELELALAVETNEARPNVFNGHKVDAQWFYFTRDESERKALSATLDSAMSIAETVADPAHQKRHLELAARVDVHGVQVGLFLHRNAWVDAKNAIQKLQDPFEADVLDKLLVKVDGAFSGLRDLDGGTPISSLSAQKMAAVLMSLGMDGRRWLKLGCSFASDSADVGTKDFANLVGDVLLALAPLYRFLAWSPTNDHLGLRAKLDAQKAAIEVPAGTLAPGATVSITSGLFAGKKGKVVDFDKKGMVKVAVGKMVVQVKAKALKVL